MLKKLRKLLIIFVVLGGLGYIAFLVFVNPSGFTDKEELVNSYFDNIQSSDVCDEHFNPETVDFCTSFKTLLDGRTLEITDLSKNGDQYELTILIDSVETEFIVSFIEIPVTGLKSFMNGTYYKIDFII